LTAFIESVCDRLAAAGYVALAPDLFGDGRTADAITDAEQRFAIEDFEGVQTLVRGAVQLLSSHTAVQGSSIGLIGFSYGAPYALLAASNLAPDKIKAVVLFYGNYPGLEADFYGRSQSAYLGHFAETDPYEDAASVTQTQIEMEKAGREAIFYTYPGTGHWFFESNKPDAYDADAANLAWERTLTFLQAQLN
jgi:carboxymethylenebutenolidase